MKYHVFVFVFWTISFLGFGQEIIQGNSDTHIYKDSIGNLITREQALVLLKTGKYISVPAMNAAMEVEHTIRKPKASDNGKYQTYTDGNLVMATTGVKPVNVKIGDTLASVEAFDRNGVKHLLIDRQEGDMLIVFLEGDNVLWRSEIEPHITQIASTYPQLKVVLCSNTKTSLQRLFSERTLKKLQNVFYADKPVIKGIDVTDFVTYILTDRKGKVQLVVPPLPKSEIVLSFLQQYLKEK